MNFSSRAKPERLSSQNFYSSNKLYFFCRFFHTKHTCPGWDSLPELWAPYAPRFGSVRGRYGSPCEPGKRAFNTRKVFQSMASFTETRVEPSRLEFWFRQKFVGSLCKKNPDPRNLSKPQFEDRCTYFKEQGPPDAIGLSEPLYRLHCMDLQFLLNIVGNVLRQIVRIE